MPTLRVQGSGSQARRQTAVVLCLQPAAIPSSSLTFRTLREQDAQDPGLGDPGLGDSGLGDSGLGDPGLGDSGLGDPDLGDSGLGRFGLRYMLVYMVEHGAVADIVFWGVGSNSLPRKLSPKGPKNRSGESVLDRRNSVH